MMDPLAPPAPFLRSLRHILDHESSSIVSWTPAGDAFEIHDIAALAQRVLPKYFKHANYCSFQRQLNYFRFRKWTRLQADVCTFSNELFHRDAPELMRHIVRKKSQPQSKAAHANRAATPYERPHAFQRWVLEPIAPPMKAPQLIPQSPVHVSDHPSLASLCYSNNDYSSLPVSETPTAAAAVEPLDLAWLEALYPTLDAVRMLDEDQQQRA